MPIINAFIKRNVVKIRPITIQQSSLAWALHVYTQFLVTVNMLLKSFPNSIINDYVCVTPKHWYMYVFELCQHGRRSHRSWGDM